MPITHDTSAMARAEIMNVVNDDLFAGTVAIAILDAFITKERGALVALGAIAFIRLMLMGTTRRIAMRTIAIIMGAMALTTIIGPANVARLALVIAAIGLSIVHNVM